MLERRGDGIGSHISSFAPGCPRLIEGLREVSDFFPSVSFVMAILYKSHLIEGSLDGGGIRGLSELLILKELMERIQYQEDLPEVPLPCEYFDLIGGTGTGG